MSKTVPLISCDEAGFTGPKLLDTDQTIFSYASHDLSPEDAMAIVDDIRTSFKLQSQELKAGVLRKRNNCIEIATAVSENLEGRAMAMICDKRLNIGGKTYEYIFEPVLAANSALFYQHNLHRFIMNALHRVLYRKGEPIHDVALQLQAFMRSFRPEDAPSLFDGRYESSQANIVLNCVLRFARGYSDIIARDSVDIQKERFPLGKWTLDLTSNSLWSLLFFGWGHRHDQLEVLCDDSKPLGAVVDEINKFVGKSVNTEISDGQNSRTMRLHLVKPIRFGSSEANPTLQIADVLAGLSVDAIRFAKDPVYSGFLRWLDRHIHPDYTLPDDELIDARKILPRVNLAVLQELAKRADRGAAPLKGMSAVYRKNFLRFKSPASRVRNPLQSLLGRL